MEVERRGAIEVWTLARPEARNALDAATFRALEAALDAAVKSAWLRAVVLTGRGEVFASGGDLRELRDARGVASAASLFDAGRLVCDGLRALAVPVVAALPGPAIGGGAELALACDLRVADPAASFTFKHARMGVTTAWGSVPRLVSTVGHGAAARLLLTGCTVGANEALGLGLVSEVTPAGGALARAEAMASEIALGAPAAIAGLKALLAAEADADGTRRARDLERRWFEQTWASPDHEDAVEAFFARRAPRWQAR